MATMTALKSFTPVPGAPSILITERSVLTDRYVFARMMKEEGHMSSLEWDLYMKWFDFFAKDIPVKGILYVTTSAPIAKERIIHRGREGEESISLTYLSTLDRYHQEWIATTPLPTLAISTDDSLEETVKKIRTFCKSLC